MYYVYIYRERKRERERKGGTHTHTYDVFIIQQFNLSEIGIGLVFLVGPLVYMFTSFVAGRLTDKLVCFFFF